MCLLYRLQLSLSATQGDMCLCSSVKKKQKNQPTYVHESLILNANTVTCKHVFSVAFQSSLLLLSRRTACVGLHKKHIPRSHCVSQACCSGKQDHAPLMAKQNKSSSEGKQPTIKHKMPVADQNLTCVCVCVCVCVSVSLNACLCLSLFTMATAHFTWH